MNISIIIPAHNEELYIGKCIDSIRKAEKYAHMKTQIIVAANRCTDKTVQIASDMGAEICLNQDKCISSVRNSGARMARGDILITIDADSYMTESALDEVCDMLGSGKYIGGGTMSVFERRSFGIFMSSLYVAKNLMPLMLKNKAILSGGMFWLYKKDFDEINGFNEELVSLEDMDFAIRLKQLGEKKDLKYATLKKSRIITSSRKFDEFGDWYLIKNKGLTKAIFTGKDKEAADKFYYDVR